MPTRRDVLMGMGATAAAAVLPIVVAPSRYLAVDFGVGDMTTWSSFYRLSDGRTVRDLLDAADPNYPMLTLDHIDFGDRE